MVEGDFGEHSAQRGGDNVGRVKPAAEPRFKGDDVAALRVVVEHGGGRHKLEFGYRVVHLLHMRLENVDRPGQVVVGNARAVNGYALVEVEHKRGDIAAAAVTGRCQRVCDIRRRRTLAVRARYVHESQVFLRTADPAQ